MNKEMRDDSLLYSGVTSSSFASRKTNPIVEKAKQEKASKQNILSKSGEVVIEFFDKEIERLCNIDYVEVEKMINDEHFKAEMMARKKTVEKLREIKTRLSRIMEAK